ncbi:hypothetical protein LTR27_008048 [Elasticomyces elasticus]|nr:hypothetical protein LTR27_008048 [Elasticomyces elasticus]
MGLRRRNVKTATVTQTSNGGHASDGNQIATPAFFRLPPELRNLIYELALPRNEDYLSVRRSTPRSPFPYVSSANVPPLLATCRLIRGEALPVFYGANNFMLALDGNDGTEWGKVRDTLRWLESIDPRGITHLAHLTFFGCLRCGWETHVHVLKMQVSFDTSGSRQTIWVDCSDVPGSCPAAASRARCAKELLQEYAALWDATRVEGSGEEARVALLETVKRVHESLLLSWWDRRGVRILDVLAVSAGMGFGYLCVVGLAYLCVVTGMVPLVRWLESLYGLWNSL